MAIQLPKLVAPTPPTPSGTGFEKLLITTSIGLGKAENAVMDVAYGKADGLGGVTFPGNKAKTNGLIPILREINKIDLCNVINYALGNISLLEGRLGEQVGKVRDKAKEILDILDGNYTDPSKAKDPKKVALLIGYLSEINELIDSEICTIFPKIQTFKNNLTNSIGELAQYNAAVSSYNILSEASGSQDVLNALQNQAAPTSPIQIAVAEVKRLTRIIKDVKEVLEIIVNVTSVGDLTSRLIPNEIQELQKIVNPAKLVPALRTILAYVRGLNQVTQQLLGYVNVARTIVQVVSVIIKVVKIAIQIFRLLPMPLMFATSGVMDGLVWARQLLDDQLLNAEKRIAQIGRLIELIYAFCVTVASIIQEVLVQIETLIFTLESCSPTPIVAELKQAKGQLQSSLAQLKELTANYEKAKASSTETTYNGYILRIEEEEVEEVTIRNKRRRAIAYDYRNIMVMASDLTFATDNSILFEEVRLMLVNAGLTQDTGAALPSLEELQNVLTLPTSTDDIYASIGMVANQGVQPQEQMQQEMRLVQKQINTVISNIKGGDDLKKISQKAVASGSAQLKTDIQNGIVDPTANQQITGGLTTATDTVKVSTGDSINPDILTDEEVARLEAFTKSTKEGPKSGFLTQTAVYKNAVKKLELNKAAREAAKK